MIKVRKGTERGHFNHDWLETYHTFSFADYYDPRFQHFGHLRVINEDIVQPGEGFPPHSHRDMEIVTYILSGRLEHKDSMGNTSVIRAGEVQRMSAGSGVTHSEYNASASEPVHLLQIWLFPDTRDLPPEYEQKLFPAAEKKDRLRLIVSPDGAEGSLRIHQDAKIHASVLSAGKGLDLTLNKGRMGWLQLTSGSLKFGDLNLEAGDAVSVKAEQHAGISAAETCEFLFFDLKEI